LRPAFGVSRKLNHSNSSPHIGSLRASRPLQHPPQWSARQAGCGAPRGCELAEDELIRRPRTVRHGLRSSRTIASGKPSASREPGVVVSRRPSCPSRRRRRRSRSAVERRGELVLVQDLPRSTPSMSLTATLTLATVTSRSPRQRGRGHPASGVVLVAMGLRSLFCPSRARQCAAGPGRWSKPRPPGMRRPAPAWPPAALVVGNSPPAPNFPGGPLGSSTYNSSVIEFRESPCRFMRTSARSAGIEKDVLQKVPTHR